MLFRLWNYLRGYVIIIIEGFFIEKFINICARRRIHLWDVRLQSERRVTARMSISGFRLIRPVARKTGCRVRLLRKRGLPFVFSKYRRRKAFFAGAVLFFILINVLASFVWSIEITGNEKLDTVFLENALAANGIRTGALKYRIDTRRAVERMMLEIGRLSWISISIKGTKVKVQVRERGDIPEIVPRHIPCDIVALRDGIIRQVIAKEGIEAVSEGDTVKKGQVLISGRVPVKGEEQYRLVHAMGTVSARTWYEDEAPVVLTRTETVRTGRAIRDHSLILFSKELDLIRKKVRFSEYVTEESRKKLSIGDDLVFPFEWVTVTHFEVATLEASISEEDARETAAREAYEKALRRVPERAEIISENIYFTEQDGKLTAKAVLECIENIGIPIRIGGN
ncbi:MAG TPA: sporulation protein YqfD [Clostridiales bacterium]|nr:sporulation protein YqfD [Clostridiales bacterium]